MYSGEKWRVRCTWCGWKGVRTDSLECECYEDWAPYCRAGSPGPGCPRGVVWPCPRCRPTRAAIRAGHYHHGSTVIAVAPGT
jgi:hypothetical protein